MSPTQFTVILIRLKMKLKLETGESLQRLPRIPKHIASDPDKEVFTLIYFCEYTSSQENL